MQVTRVIPSQAAGGDKRDIVQLDLSPKDAQRLVDDLDWAVGMVTSLSPLCNDSQRVLFLRRLVTELRHAAP